MRMILIIIMSISWQFHFKFFSKSQFEIGIYTYKGNVCASPSAYKSNLWNQNKNISPDYQSKNIAFLRLVAFLKYSESSL